jgi:Domain of unknown function (DUF222)
MSDGIEVDREQADVLAGRICAAASLSAQGECQLLELIGEFDAAKAIRWWHDVKSLAQWLSWACSMSPGTAREHVRVARGLRQMPTITTAFREGRLSYSKVREATRVVGLIDEHKLCQLALTATASQLARMVSGFRRATGSRIKQQPARALTWTERDDEMIDFRIRLPKEEAALVIAALTAAKDQFGAPRRRRPTARASTWTPHRSTGTPTPSWKSRAGSSTPHPRIAPVRIGTSLSCTWRRSS